MVDPNRIQQRDRPMVRPGDEPAHARSPKQQPSPFDQVLQQRIVQQTPTFQQQLGKDASGQQQRAEQKERQQERKEKGRTREKDDGPRNTEDHERTDARDTGPKHRVVVKTTRDGEGGRQGRGGEGGGQGFGGGRGGGGPGTRAKSNAESAKQLSDLKAGIARAGVSKFQQEVATQKQQATTIDRKQMQHLVNLMVQSIRVGKNEVGASALSVVFHTAIFHGLRLRLESKNGKVSVHFVSSSGEVRALFTKERNRIRDALERKGVSVDTVDVA